METETKIMGWGCKHQGHPLEVFYPRRETSVSGTDCPVCNESRRFLITLDDGEDQRDSSLET